MINRNAQMMATIRSDEEKPIRRFARREKMYSAVNDTLGNVPISYLEFGVWKGESLKAWTAINTVPLSRFYGFDSFEGLPEVWTHGFGRVTGNKDFDLGGVMPTGFDPRVKLVKGWFQHTLSGFLAQTELAHPIVIQIDSDLHSSALYVLSSLDRLLRSDDVIIFDEYASPSNEYLAWEEYKRAFMRNANCIAMSDHWSQAAFVLE